MKRPTRTSSTQRSSRDAGAQGSGEEVDSQAPTRRAKQVEEGDPTPRGLKIIVIFPAEFEYFMPNAMSYGALARQG